MPFDDRKQLISKIEELRGGRRLLCFLNFDRVSDPGVQGLSTQFHAEVKEAFFRILKESKPEKGVDLFLYTRGGDTNSVWPLVSVIREFDPDFEVIAPFRCHSSGTLAALGARRIHLGPLSELSPIDPSTGNQFNPVDPANQANRLAIGVEDVTAFRDFIALQLVKDESKLKEDSFRPFLERLVGAVHPLALGNVQRVVKQINQLAEKLLALHPVQGENTKEVIANLTSAFHSHLHMINRDEASRILGTRISFMDNGLADASDALLRSYEDDFNLRQKFYLASFLGNDLTKDVRFVGGVAEAAARSYLFVTSGVLRQTTKLPPNVQVQIPPGQPMPLVQGLPRDIQFEIAAQGWKHNEHPQGVTK
ncbi:MAG: hypothetical protein KF689_14445 [Gemmatimonadaceae bacterium]|nr:hypothetical protein [Gemmatimonadaceae bacterium]